MKNVFILLIAVLINCSCNKEQLLVDSASINPKVHSNDFISGLSYVAMRDEISATEMKPVKEMNSNYIAVMPFAMGRKGEPTLEHDDNHQWWGETVIGVRKTIELAREREIKVMLKPQIWFRGGFYTGHFELGNEKDWQEFENNYRDYILKFLKIAVEEEVEMFCIGTELETFIDKRPKFWKNLIAEIRLSYSGILTYAANWDAYKRTWIWNDLDLIGVDAYFPLSGERIVTKDSLKAGWKPWIEEMKGVSEKFGKKVIFAEWGYRNIEYSANRPWESDNDNRVRNNQNQSLLIETAFEEAFSQDFIVGGFLWKWFPFYENRGGENDLGFTPQNKPAEEVLRYQYSIVQTLD